MVNINCPDLSFSLSFKACYLILRIYSGCLFYREGYFFQGDSLWHLYLSYKSFCLGLFPRLFIQHHNLGRQRECLPLGQRAYFFFFPEEGNFSFWGNDWVVLLAVSLKVWGFLRSMFFRVTQTYCAQLPPASISPLPLALGGQRETNVDRKLHCLQCFEQGVTCH